MQPQHLSPRHRNKPPAAKISTHRPPGSVRSGIGNAMYANPTPARKGHKCPDRTATPSHAHTWPEIAPKVLAKLAQAKRS